VRVRLFGGHYCVEREIEVGDLCLRTSCVGRCRGKAGSDDMVAETSFEEESGKRKVSDSGIDRSPTV